jgi:hypothetical protein
VATQAAQPDNYIDLILGTKVRVMNVQPPVAQTLAGLGGATTQVDGRPAWEIKAADDAALAALLQQLRDLGVLFVNEPAGWPPAAIFADLRARGLVQGQYQEITWRGPGQWSIYSR